jgi:hypothetical protein
MCRPFDLVDQRDRKVFHGQRARSLAPGWPLGLTKCLLSSFFNLERTDRCRPIPEAIRMSPSAHRGPVTRRNDSIPALLTAVNRSDPAPILLHADDDLDQIGLTRGDPRLDRRGHIRRALDPPRRQAHRF